MIFEILFITLIYMELFVIETSIFFQRRLPEFQYRPLTINSKFDFELMRVKIKTSFHDNPSVKMKFKLKNKLIFLRTEMEYHHNQ